MKTLLAIFLLAALPSMGQDLSITQKWNPHGTQGNVLYLMSGAAGTTSIIELPAKYVVVKFYSPGEQTTCPHSVPTVSKNEDGSYHRSYPTIYLTVSCYSKPREWYEFWTDYPDKGGKFIGEWKKD